LSAWFKRLVPTLPSVELVLEEKPRPNNRERTKWAVKWSEGAAPEKPF
jgi:hypothetical protein